MQAADTYYLTHLISPFVTNLARVRCVRARALFSRFFLQVLPPERCLLSR